MSTEPQLEERGTPRPSRGAQILPFRPRRQGLRTRPPVTDPLRRFDAEEDRRRMAQNLAAALVVAFLILSGLWIFDQLRAASRITACLEAGHRNCLPLEPQRR